MASRWAEVKGIHVNFIEMFLINLVKSPKI